MGNLQRIPRTLAAVGGSDRARTKISLHTKFYNHMCQLLSTIVFVHTSCFPCSSNASKSQGPSQEAVIALRPQITDLVLLPPSPSAIQRMQQLQQRQRDLCDQQQQQQQQQLKRPRLSQLQSLQHQAAVKPWLGAQLDVGGYTKKGFISGGGKDTNQDRCVDGSYCRCGGQQR